MLRCCSFAIALLFVLLDGAATAAIGRPIVYSKVTWEWVGPEGARTEVRKGGLFASVEGKPHQLTETPGDRQPSVSPDGQAVIFVRDGDLYTMNADGSGQRQLSTGPEIDERPLIAPNGRYVVFIRRASLEGAGDLYAISLPGGPPRSLTTWPGEDREPAFSRDSETVVFVRSLPAEDGGTNDELFSVRLTGSGLTRLTRTPQDEFHPVCLAERIIFNRRKTAAGGLPTIVAMRRDGTGAAILVARKPGETIGAVSPNGRLLLFSRFGRGLWVKRLVGSGERTRPHPLYDRAGGGLVFSPDGRRVAGLFISSEGVISLRSINIRTGSSRNEGEVFELEASGPVQTYIDGSIAW
jgi:Tol biopolymer transport system component